MTARLIALVTSLWFLVGGMLAVHHEARAAHFVDGNGLAFHGSRMTGEHTQGQSDVHSRDAAPDHDACAIAMALDHAAIETFAPALAVVARVGAPAHDSISYLVLTADLLLVAPKTSPPAQLV